MLTSIQQQLEALASDRRRGDQVNTYKDEVRKIGEKYRASQKRESLLVKEKAQLVARISKLEADLEHQRSKYKDAKHQMKGAEETALMFKTKHE